MAVKSIRRGPAAGGAPPNFISRQVANDIYVDGATDKLVFSTGTSGSASKTVVSVGDTFPITTPPTTGFTATAGGGQTNATLLTNGLNRIDTIVSAGDSVKLPLAVAGQLVVVINNSNNPVQVFGSGTDTINNIATAVGISQPANSVDIYYAATSAPAGTWYVESGVGFSGSLFTESSQDNITARSGGGQAVATQITTQTARVVTVNAAGDSIKLPVSAPGLELLIMNSGPNSMQVYGSGSDTIDGVAFGTGVSQMSNSLVIYSCAAAGAWFSEGLATGFGGAGLQTLSFINNITAFAGGGQLFATPLTAMMNRVTTVATAGDSVRLPISAAGLQVTIVNRGLNPCQVFGASTDTINGIVTGTGISQAVNAIVTYYCSVAGNWETGSAGNQPIAISTLSVNGAIPAHTPHSYVITKTSTLSDTLAAPTVGTDDGIVITIISNTAFAHVITATGLLQTGTASVNSITFPAQAGASVNFIAYQGKWNVTNPGFGTYTLA